MTTQRTGYDAIFNSIDDLLDPKVLVPGACAGMTVISKNILENFNTWCDAIHVDCNPQDPEVQTDSHLD